MCFRPLAGSLRCEGEADRCVAYAEPFANAARASFSRHAQLQKVLDALDSIAVLLKNSDANNQKPMASTVRQALQVLDDLDSKSPLALSLKHGALGQHLRKQGALLVKQNANDTAARNKLRTVKEALQTELSEGCGFFLTWVRGGWVTGRSVCKTSPTCLTLRPMHHVLQRHTEAWFKL